VTRADAIDSPDSLRDPDAVEAIYRRDGPSIRSFLRHWLNDFRAADDVLQETFLELWRKPQGYDPARGSVRQFLFGIARRRAAQWRRDNPAARVADSAAVVTMVADAAESAAIRQALQQLDEDERSLLWLREVEGYSYDELATLLEVPVGTVKSRLFTARAALRRLWLGDRFPRSAMR
jgi:RNA polymerase sigma-70 factor (ECF subfamily)